MDSTRVAMFRRGVGHAAWLLLAVLLLYVYWMLAGNPGYFSHDELQWGAFADVPDWRLLPWQDPAALTSFQYRPLTFNLWLLLSYVLFDTPWAMHAAWVAMGLANATLLALLLHRFGSPRRVAVASSALFLLSPYAVYVHGWVATLADLLWVGFGLLTALLVLAMPRAPDRRGAVLLVIGGGVLVSLGLLSKEAALSVPVLLGIAFLWCRQPRWGWAACGAAAVALVYLVLRADVLLFQTPQGTGYGWALWRIPERFAQYQVFTFHPWSFEIDPLFRRPDGRLFAIAGLTAAAFVLALRGTRPIAWFLLASAAALGPVLILHSASNQYGYGFAIVLAATLGLAWPTAGRSGRAAIMVLAVLSSWHGARVAADMARVGALQARFSPSLAALVEDHAGAEIRLRPDCPADRWVYVRLTHKIPSYAGVRFGNRVTLADESESTATHVRCTGLVVDEASGTAAGSGAASEPL